MATGKRVRTPTLSRPYLHEHENGGESRECTKRKCLPPERYSSVLQLYRDAHQIKVDSNERLWNYPTKGVDGNIFLSKTWERASWLLSRTLDNFSVLGLKKRDALMAFALAYNDGMKSYITHCLLLRQEKKRLREREFSEKLGACVLPYCREAKVQKQAYRNAVCARTFMPLIAQWEEFKTDAEVKLSIDKPYLTHEEILTMLESTQNPTLQEVNTVDVSIKDVSSESDEENDTKEVKPLINKRRFF